MADPDFSSIAVRSYADLITAMRAVKNFLQLSNERVEDIAGLTRGHWDKIAGACPTKKAGPMALDALLGALAIELVPRINPEALKRVQARYQRRNEKQIRNCQPVSQALLDKCRPIILAELTRNATLASVMARKGKSRRARNGNGHARV